MNISATYNMLPDLSLSFPKSQPLSPYPLSRPEGAVDLPVKAETEASSGEARAYKFYVLSDSSDTVYTRRKQMEKLFASDKGSLLDLYV